MTSKKKDLAQELVDFLMKEDDIVRDKKEKAAPKLVLEQNRDQKTISLKDEKTIVPEALNLPSSNEPVFEFSIHDGDLSMDDSKVNSKDEGRNTVRLEDPSPLEFKTEEKSKSERLSQVATVQAEKPNTTMSTRAIQEEPVKPESSPDIKVVSSQMATPLSSQRANIVFNDVANLLAGTEAVKVAQARIKALEKEKEQARNEFDQLLSGGEALQRRLNELRAQHESLERKHKEKIEILEDEKSVLKTRLNAKDEELNKIRQENEELHSRFQNDLRKIRVRERELEGRQEIMRAEMSTLVAGKDEIIMELRRQLEKLSFEIDTFRAKSVDSNNKLTEFYDRNHRTVKALRLALSILEVGNPDDKSKKAG